MQPELIEGIVQALGEGQAVQLRGLCPLAFNRQTDSLCELSSARSDE